MDIHYQDTKNIYIGELIRQKVDERHISYAEFARLIHRARTSLYHIFEAKTIDIDLLILIGRVLDYDFITNVYMSTVSHSRMHEVTHPVMNGNLPAIDDMSSYLILPVTENGIDVSRLPHNVIALLRKAVL